MISGEPYVSKYGEWTDDTSIALCLAESLIDTGGFNPIDQLQRFVRWYRDGHLIENDRCVDIGGLIDKMVDNLFEISMAP